MSTQEEIELGRGDVPPPIDTVPVSALDPYDEAVLRDPYPHYKELRDAGPVVWLRRYGVYAAVCYDEARAILDDHETFCSSAGAGLTNFHTSKPWRKPSIILEVDPPEHDRTRKVMARVLSPAALRPLRARFEAEAETMIDALLAKGECDLARDLAVAFPIKVFGDAVGIPENGRHNLLPYGDMVFNGFGPANERFKACLAGLGEAIEWIGAACKRDSLTGDGFGPALYAAADDGQITEEEAGLLVRTLLSAGLDTTIYALCIAFVNFGRHADQWQVLCGDPSLARQSLEEVLRYDGTFHSYFRTTTRAIEIAGIPLKPNQKVVVFTASANRDARRWDSPDKFDIRRNAQGHLAFGHGIHVCAGQMVSRLEGEVLLQALARKVQKIELVGEPTMHFNNTVRGYSRIPAQLVPHAN